VGSRSHTPRFADSTKHKMAVSGQRRNWTLGFFLAFLGTGRDVRLVRNVWTKGNVAERVKNVKFMWGIFACNELLLKRFGMGDSAKCDVCNGIESPWHVIGEGPGKRAVEIQTDTGRTACGGSCRKRLWIRKRHWHWTWRMR
jgi:hypothetical protein